MVWQGMEYHFSHNLKTLLCCFLYSIISVERPDADSSLILNYCKCSVCVSWKLLDLLFHLDVVKFHK